MKSKLQEVSELSNKYVDLCEFKKSSCINIDLYVPILKLDEDDEGLSDTQLDQIKMNKRKRRRYMNSFFSAENLVEGDEQPLSCISYFETKDREILRYALANLIKVEPVPVSQSTPVGDKRM